jgi:hypothetical protein
MGGNRRAWLVWGLAAGFYLVALFHRMSLGVASLDAQRRFDLSPGTIATLSALQQTTALLPDYDFAREADAPSGARLGTSVAGLVGGTLTLVVALVLGWVIRRRGPRR